MGAAPAAVAQADSHVPAHYKAELERQAAAQRAAAAGAGSSPRLPGTDVPHRGGWPIEKSVGPKMMPPEHVGGFSIEKSLGPRADNALFTRISPSA